MKRIVTCFSARWVMLLPVLFLAPALLAQRTYDVKVKNSPAGANDIHLTFAGTGGTVKMTTPVNPAKQNIKTNAMGNGLDADWSPALPAGSTYEATFQTAGGGITFAGGNWTKDGDQLGGIDPDDVTLTDITNAPTVLQVRGSTAFRPPPPAPAAHPSIPFSPAAGG